MAFQVGAIVAELQLRKDKWDQSIKKVKDDQKSLTGLITRNSQQFRKMGMAMTVAGGAIVGAIGLMVKAYGDFDQAMTESLAIMGDVSDEMREDMAAVARTISTETVYSAKELAAAYFFLASAGMDVHQSMAALLPVAQFAQAGTFDLATATDLLTDAQTALGLSSKNALENQENLIRVSDVLVGANTLANASVEQFAEALTNKAAAALVNLNIEMEEGVAVLAAYADKGLKGQIAGQRLTMMLNGLFDATRRNKKAWDEAGISLFKADGSMRAIADIIQDLEGYLGAMTVKQREATLAQLGFNLRTKDSILTLMGSSQKIREWTENLKDMQGITKEVADKQLETFNNQLKLLKNTIMDAAIEIGGTLTPALQKLVINIKDVVGGLTDWIKEHPTLTEYITKSGLAVGGLLLVLGPLAMMLPGLVQGFLLLGPAIGAMMGPITLVVGGLTLLTLGIVTIFEDALREERKWLDNSVLINAALDDMSVSMEATRLAAGMSVKEWKKLRKEYDNNDMALARAIEKGKEGLTLQNAQIKSTREIRKAKEAQEKIEKTLTETTDGFSKSVDKQTEAIIKAIYATDKLIPSLEDMGGVIKDLPPDMSKFGQTSKDVFNNLIPGLGKVKKGAEEFDGMLITLKTDQEIFGTTAVTTNEKIAAGLIKIAKDVEITWENVAKNMTDYWSNAMAQMVKEGINLPDILNIGWQTMAVGAGSAISKVISEVGSLGKLAGPLGALAGSIAGTAISAIGSILGIKSAAQKAADEAQRAAEALATHVSDITRVMSKYGEITEATAKKIQEADKTMTGFAAVSKYFGDVIKDVGVTQENVNLLWDRAVGIIENWKQGHLSAAEAAKAAGESFTLLLDGAQKLGQEGSEAMINFILKTRELGLEVREVTEYVVSQLDRIPEALEGLLAPAVKVGESLDVLKEKLAAQNEELEGLEKGTDIYSDLLAAIGATQEEIDAATDAFMEFGDDIEHAGMLALTTFNAMRAEGLSLTEVIAKMKDPLIALRDQYDTLGLDANAALEKLFGIIDVTEANKELFEAIDANRTILEALGNTGYLTGEILNSFAEEAIGNYEELKVKFGDSDDALRAMGPTLQKIKDFADAYNITLDEGTQKLIDQATELGVVKEKQESVQDVAKKGFGDMKLILEDIKNVLIDIGDKLKGSGIYQKLKDVDSVSKTTWGNMTTDIGSVIGKVGGLDTKFGTTFSNAEIAARLAGQNINAAIGAIQPRVDVGFNYDLPDFSNLKGNVDLGFSGGGKGIPEFQHGGVIEAGPRQPTLFMFGEGPKREVAEIRHMDGERGSGINVPITINNEWNISGETAMNPRKLEEMFRRNVGEMTQKIKEFLDRY